MENTLYLPEIREMLAEQDTAALQEFCKALHPARTADFMGGLESTEVWQVLQYADPSERVEIFSYLPEATQLEIVRTEGATEVAALITELASDDRVDLLQNIEKPLVQSLLGLLPAEDRRDILRLQAYPEGTAGSVMTTEFAKLAESMTVQEAFQELGRQVEDLETVYYLYIVDEQERLRGLVSARNLISAINKPNMLLQDLMDTQLIAVLAGDDQEQVAQKVARYDLLAIPVIDEQNHMLGIITHDDVIDVIREEAVEDAYRSAAVAPLGQGYFDTHLLSLTWSRGIWLAVLFFAALLTAIVLKQYEARIESWAWLSVFIPLIISSGGNSGNQSATLIITALTLQEISFRDWWRVVKRELAMGLLLGSGLALCGILSTYFLFEETRSFPGIAIIPLTLLLVVICGTCTGSILPLLFKRLGLDPALMSSPFVAGIIDILGIVIYMNIAVILLTSI
ncbi:MAG: magnesium transporter [Pirellulaceae bacterium]|nr:magnesium transporter [Pirellulaceae bacterium]